MALSDHAQGNGTTRPDVPALLNDYRALQEAVREHMQGLVRVREEVLQAADREARSIVSTARSEIRRILVKARGELLSLATQVQTTIDLPAEIGSAGTPGLALPGADTQVRAAHETLVSARRETRSVLDSAHPDLAALEEQLKAFVADIGREKTAPRQASAPQRDAPAFPREAPTPVGARAPQPGSAVLPDSIR